MNQKLLQILTGLIILFIIIAGVLWLGAFGFHGPDAGTHTKKDEPKKIAWSFDGPTGTFDKASVQRGYKVYKDVCAACHSMKLVSFRNLKGAGFSDAEIKSLAAEYNYPEMQEDGSMKDMPGKPSSRFKSPYESTEAAAAANGGAAPPDLSLMAKAREDGPNYVYSVLTGYGKTAAYVCTAFETDGSCSAYRLANPDDVKAHADATKARQVAADAAKKANQVLPPLNKDKDKPDNIYNCIPQNENDEKTPAAELKDVTNKDGHRTSSCTRLPDGKYFNHFFPGQVISMPAPLTDGKVDYEDGTKNDTAQEAKDVVNFLQYVAEPEMELRKRMGIKVIIFLSIMTAFFYVAKVRIWARVQK